MTRSIINYMLLSMHAWILALIFAPLLAHADPARPLELMRNFETKFQDLVQQSSGGKPLRVLLRPEVPSDTSSPYETPTEWQIIVNGGLLDTKDLTSDAFELILCHELGHFLGGEPRSLWKVVTDPDGKKRRIYHFSVEGQSDYYATKTCLKDLWADRDNTPAPASALDPALPQAAIDRCGKDLLCQRISRAGYVYARHYLPNEPSWMPSEGGTIDFFTPAPARANHTTLESHASAQCRLDTFFAGALGAPRPVCWFAEH